jgi:Ca-activated chloride channel family protein
VDEVVKMAKRYGITTPYTSWLIVPDGPMPVVPSPRPRGAAPLPARAMPFGGAGGVGGFLPPALEPAAPGGKPANVADFARRVQEKPGDVAANRDRYATGRVNEAKAAKGDADGTTVLGEARMTTVAYDTAAQAMASCKQSEVQAGKLGVDLSVQTNNPQPGAARIHGSADRQWARLRRAGRCLDRRGFDPKMPTVVVKAQSDAYFRVRQRHKTVKDVFRLGNHVVWVAPNGTALVIDTNDGKEKLSDEEIDKLFVVAKK